MLYVLYGNDKEKARAQFRKLHEGLAKKAGEEHIAREGEVTSNFLDEAIASQGLFGGATLFVFDNVLEKKIEQELLASRAVEMSASLNYFLVFESGLDKGTLEALRESGVSLEEFSIKKVDGRPEFNIFSLGDALGKRNKKDLWVLYQRALSANLEPEEICGTLFWGVKNIALMKNAKAGDVAGLNPFVASKAREFAKNYTEKEIMALSGALTRIYHEAHRGGEPMDIALERFILEL